MWWAGLWAGAKGIHAISRKAEHPLHIMWCGVVLPQAGCLSVRGLQAVC